MVWVIFIKIDFDFVLRITKGIKVKANKEINKTERFLGELNDVSL